jgi:hypothetical protein
VAEPSAAPILDDTDRAGIAADHRNMCKFSSRKAPGYRLVVATLMRYSEGAPQTIEARWTEARELLRSIRRSEAQDLIRDAV